MSLRSVEQKCGSEVLLRSVDEKGFSKVWIRSVDQKCCSEAQKCQFSSLAQKCRSEVSMSSVDQKCWSEVLLRTVDEKCGSEVLVIRVNPAVWFSSVAQTVDQNVDQVSLTSFAQKCQSEVWVRVQKSRSEKVSLRSVAQKCRSEKVWFRSVDQVSL